MTAFSLRRLVGGGLAATVALTLLPVGAALAAPSVSVDAPGGIARDRATTVTVSGTGFQSVQGGFGGIYVLFGTIASDSWAPSAGGATGEDYRYAYDDETNPAGYQSLVAFPGSATGYAATGGQISADGSWSTTLTIPGERFTAYDRAGNASEVDCSQVRCGIITIGAHGVINANNESFTPVTFSDNATGEAPSADQGAASDTSAAAGSQAPASQTDASSAGVSQGGSAGTPITIQTAPADTEMRVSTLLLIIGATLLGLAIIVLAAGVGGYLATKALILGVSPTALERERARQERKAARLREKNEARARQRESRRPDSSQAAAAPEAGERSRSSRPATASRPEAGADVTETGVLSSRDLSSFYEREN